jgi:hypothetical protein
MNSPPGTLNLLGTVLRVYLRMITPMLTTKYAKMVPTEEISLRTWIGKSPPQKAQRIPEIKVLVDGVYEYDSKQKKTSNGHETLCLHEIDISQAV